MKAQDIPFSLNTLALFAAVGLLLTYPKLKGKGLLLAALALLVVSGLSWFAFNKLLVSGKISVGKDNLWVYLVPLNALAVGGHLCLLGFVVLLRPRPGSVDGAGVNSVAAGVSAQGQGPTSVVGIKCAKCETINKPGIVRCSECKASLHPVPFAIITALGLVLNILMVLGGLLLAAETPRGLVMALIAAFVTCVLVALRKGKYWAWVGIQWIWGLNVLVLLLGSVALQKQAGGFVLVVLVTAVLILYLLLRYFHTPAVKNFCSVGKT